MRGAVAGTTLPVLCVAMATQIELDVERRGFVPENLIIHCLEGAV